MKKLKKYFPILFFALLSVVLFYKFFFFQKYPIPGDILIGHYHPWIDHKWGGIQTDYPIKSWVLFDGIKQILPWRLLVIDQLKNNLLPLWNPYILSGTPLLGNLQTAVFYPLNLLFWILPKLDAWTIYLTLQPFLAAVFSFLFLKELTKKTIPALLAGVAWGFSLIMLNHLEFGIDGHTALWLPLSLFLLEKVRKESRLKWLVLLSLSVSMTMLGGYPPPAIYSLFLLALYFLFKFRPLFSKKTILVIIFVFIGLGLSAPQTLPAYNLGTKVVREEAVFGESSGEPYFLPTENLIMLFAPDFFGHPSTWNFTSKIYYPDNASVGAACFVFWSLGLVFVFSKNKKIRKKKPEMLFWLFSALTPTLFMIDNPLGRVLRKVPISFLSDVAPMRMIWIVAFALTVLAAITMSIFDDLLKGKNKIKSKIFFFPFALIISFWILSFFLPSSNLSQSTAQRNLILPSLVSIFTILSCVVSLKFKKLWKPLSVLIILVASLELIRQGWKYNSFIDKDLVYPQTEITRYLQENIKENRLLITNVELLPSNSNIPYQIPMINGYASIRDNRYDYLVRLMDPKQKVEELKTYPRIVYQPHWKSQVANLMGVKYILSLSIIDDKQVKLILEEGKTKLYENKSIYPKAFFVTDYSVENSISSIAQKMQEINLREEVVLEEDIFQTELGMGSVELVDYKDNQITLKTHNSQTGLLVLTDSYDEGWKVKIDDQPSVPVLRADLNLRAVLVPPGDHQVVFKYLPNSFIQGIYIFTFSFLSLLTSPFWLKLSIFKIGNKKSNTVKKLLN